MALFRQALLVSLLAFTVGAAERGHGSTSTAFDITLEQEQPHPVCSSTKQGEGGASSLPVSSRQLARQRQKAEEASRRVPRRRQSGPLQALAGAAACVGDRLRAGAHHVCGEVSRLPEGFAGVVAGSPSRGHAQGSARNTRRHGGFAGLMAFGGLLQPVERGVGEEAVVSSEEMQMLQAENDASVEEVLAVIDSNGWEFVTSKSGIVVVKKFMPPPSSEAGGVVNTRAAAKFACVKAMGTLDADATELYKLFLDNERVHEYNDNCREVRDLERLSSDTKISWAATPRYGPFKARDFVTVVHYRTLEDGTMIVLNRPVEHPAARRGSKYVRAEILIATNIMRPNREDPTKTDFISVTHINPGGIVDSTLGAKLVNKLCAKAPVNLLVSLERSANSPPSA